MRELVMSTPGATVVIECRPTTPDVNVTLIGVRMKQKNTLVKHVNNFDHINVYVKPKIKLLINNMAYSRIRNEYLHKEETAKIAYSICMINELFLVT